MKKSIVLIALAFIGLSLQAQQTVALQHNGVTTIFNAINPFIAAYDSAVIGDTIYLPGGVLAAPTVIDKGLTIIGAGYNPDSTLATNFTKWSNDVRLGPNADNLFLEGIELASLVKYRDDTVNHVSVVKCRINAMNLSSNGSPTSLSSNWLFRECIFNNAATFSGVVNVLLSNSIFQNTVTGFQNSSMRNCISFPKAGYYYYPVSSANCSFYNNVFHSNTPSYVLVSGSGNTFKYNVFQDATPGLGSSFIESNNYYGILLDTFYVNQSGTTYDYSHDYHVDSATVYVGDDGNEVGVYGGYFPWKEGGVPSNPHIYYKNIQGVTELNGTLPVTIKVEAQ